MTNVSFRPLKPAFGAEVTGIDLSRPVDGPMRDTIQQALHKYGLLMLRGQQQNEPRHLRLLAEALGRIDEHPAAKFAVPGVPDVLVISNGVDADGEPIGIRDIGQFWHTDGSFLPSPHAYTVLQAIAVPRRDGAALGDTLFVSSTAAYASLTDEMKKRLEGLRSVHSYMYRLNERRKKATGTIGARGEGSPDVIHPIVLTHPTNGKKILYVNEGYTIEVVGMAQEEGHALLAELFAHLTKPEAVYRHVWNERDILIWDNAAMQHNAVKNYESAELRLMHRVMTKFPPDWAPGEIVKSAAA